MYYSWIVIGLTQVVKETFNDYGVELKPGQVRLAATVLGGLTGLFLSGGQLLGLGAGLVMGMITTGVVSTTFQALEKNSPAVVIEETPEVNVGVVSNEDKTV